MESIARFILVLQLMSSVRGKLQWEVLERVNNFGQTVKLICLSDACKNTEDCKIRTGWDRHIPDPTITFAVTTDQNNIPATNKYSGCFVQNGFTLEIRNLSKEDLDIKYECSVSSNRSEAKRLLEEDVFKGILQWEVLEQIEEYGQTLKLICLSTSCNNQSCPWKPAWARYSPKFEILLDDVRNQSEVKAGKYSGQIVEKGFTLEIRNVSTTDLKYRYQCSLPFNKSDSQVLLENDILFENSFDEDKDNVWTIVVSIISGIVVAALLVVIIAVVYLVIYKRRGRHQYSSVSAATNQIITETQNVTPRTEEDREMTDNPDRTATNQIITETQNVTPRTEEDREMTDNPDRTATNQIITETQNVTPRTGEDREMTDNPHRSATNQIIPETQNVTPRTGTDLNGTDVQQEDTDLNGADVQFQGILSNQVLTNISTRINHWELLQIALHLGFEGSKISEYQNLGDVCEQGVELFKEFISTNRCAKTDANIVAQLRKALIEVNRKDIADNFLPTD